MVEAGVKLKQAALDLTLFFFLFLNFILFIFFIQQVLISYLFYTYQCIYVNPNLPIHPTTPTSTTPPTSTFPPWCPYVCSLYMCFNGICFLSLSPNEVGAAGGLFLLGLQQSCMSFQQRR